MKPEAAGHLSLLFDILGRSVRTWGPSSGASAIRGAHGLPSPPPRDPRCRRRGPGGGHPSPRSPVHRRHRLGEDGDHSGRPAHLRSGAWGVVRRFVGGVGGAHRRVGHVPGARPVHLRGAAVGGGADRAPDLLAHHPGGRGLPGRPSASARTGGRAGGVARLLLSGRAGDRVLPAGAGRAGAAGPAATRSGQLLRLRHRPDGCGPPDRGRPASDHGPRGQHASPRGGVRPARDRCGRSGGAQGRGRRGHLPLHAAGDRPAAWPHRHLHAQALPGAARERHARPPVPGPGRRWRQRLRRGRRLRAERRRQALHRRPAPPRRRDVPGARAAHQLLQAVGQGIRGPGVRLLGPDQSRRPGPGASCRPPRGHPGRAALSRSLLQPVLSPSR